MSPCKITNNNIGLRNMLLPLLHHCNDSKVTQKVDDNENNSRLGHSSHNACDPGKVSHTWHRQNVQYANVSPWQ